MAFLGAWFCYFGITVEAAYRHVDGLLRVGFCRSRGDKIGWERTFGILVALPRMHNDTKNFAFAVLGVVLAAFLVFSGRTNRIADTQITQLQGLLEEWSEVGLAGRQPALRFRLSNQSPDFRVDPPIYRQLMGGAAPQCFTHGASLVVNALAAELRSPKSSAVDSSLRIVWVRGLECSGNEIFSPADVAAAEKRDARWGYWLLAAAVAYLAYASLRWIGRGTKQRRR